MFTMKSRFLVPAILSLLLLSCSKNTPEQPVLTTTFPPTSEVTLSFEERRVPGHCVVFSHLLVSIPSGLLETEIRSQVERFAMENGADYLLVGMARESDESFDTIIYRSYGPRIPYSFKSRWAGWKYGFKDWSSDDPLVDFGQNRIADAEPAFDTDIIVQAVLLNCSTKK